MFKRLQWKIVVMFVLLVMAVMFIAFGFMMITTASIYEKDFKSKTESVLNGEFKSSIENALKLDDEEREQRLLDVILAYSVQLGLSDDRKCSVLRASDASEIVSTSSVQSSEKTPNIITAMTGQTGNKFVFMANYMDYAEFVELPDLKEGYIIYIRDGKTSVIELMHNMTTIIIQAFLFGIVASIILGYFLSKTITMPIGILTEKAEDFAEGKFDSNLEITSGDEIGTLMEAFNYMGSIMNATLNEIAGEKHKIEIILEHVENGIIAFNTEQKIIHINSAAKRLLNIENPEAVSFDAFFGELEAKVCMAEFMYIDKLHAELREFVCGNKHIKMYFVPFKIDCEKVAGVVCVLEDITEQFKLENSQRKFVAEVSHELKTPLTIIGAYTETLLDGGLIDDRASAETFLKTIQSETTKMTALVKNLLTLSRFDAQKLELNKEYFSLDDLARELVDTFHIEAEAKGLKLVYNLINELPDVYADRFQIERAVKNIISNAIKYTPSGGTVKVYAGKIYGEAYIKVEDSGIGIPPADLPHIFDRFYRVDKARSRQMGGTGLGLSISKEIIENHGGSIVCESEQGLYTRMTVKLPVAESPLNNDNTQDKNNEEQ